MADRLMSLSIVIPCYNEQDAIGAVVSSYLDKVVSVIPGSELIVIDDCSTDNTYDIVKKLMNFSSSIKVIRTVANSGHGAAILEGYRSAAGEFVFQVDGDGQFRPEDFWKLYTLRNDYDLVLGVRRPRRDPLYRILLTRIICLVISGVFGMRIKDPNCPFRLIKKDTLNEIIRRIPNGCLAPNIVMSIMAMKMGFKVRAVTVSYCRRVAGVSSLGGCKIFIFALRGLLQLLRYKKKVSYERG